MYRLLVNVFLCFLISNTSMVNATNLEPPDKIATQVQAVVRAQLKAFAADDAKAAYLLAADEIQQMFGSANQFMQMVRNTYPVVYRPSAVMFYKPESRDDAVVQRVAMTDSQGVAWVAVYRLELRKNKAWRIAGCVLIPDTSQKA